MFSFLHNCLGTKSFSLGWELYDLMSTRWVKAGHLLCIVLIAESCKCCWLLSHWTVVVGFASNFNQLMHLRLLYRKTHLSSFSYTAIFEYINLFSYSLWQHRKFIYSPSCKNFHFKFFNWFPLIIYIYYVIKYI